jgi:hypothetical protein
MFTKDILYVVSFFLSYKTWLHYLKYNPETMVTARVPLRQVPLILRAGIQSMLHTQTPA